MKENKKIELPKYNFNKKHFACLIIYLVLVVGLILLKCYCIKFTTYYMIFTIILLTIPIGMEFSKVIYMDINKQYDIKKLNEKRNKQIIYYIFLDIVFISLMEWNIYVKYILGLSGLIIIYINLGYSFVNRPKNNKTYDFAIILDFLVGIAITVYLIWIINNKEVRDIVTAIVASVYGGLLTLAGVAWTIEYTNKNHKKDKMEEIKPLFFIIDRNSRISDKVLVNNISCYTSSNLFNSGDKYIFNNIYIKNGDYSYCVIKGISINDEMLTFNSGIIFDKNSSYEINIQNSYFSFNGEISDIKIIVSDMQNNFYGSTVTYEIIKDKEYSQIIILKGGNPKKVDIDSNNHIVELD